MVGNFLMAPARYCSYSSAFSRGVFPCQVRAMTGFPGLDDRAISPGSSDWLGFTIIRPSPRPTDVTMKNGFARFLMTSSEWTTVLSHAYPARASRFRAFSQVLGDHRGLASHHCN